MYAKIPLVSQRPRSTARRRIGDRLVDAIARRPTGIIGRAAYRNGPKAHEPSFAAILDTLGSLDGLRVLEVGCGPGVLLQRVLAAGAASAVGLDHSPDMLAIAAARNNAAIADGRLQLHDGDACQLPYPDASFDVVMSANVFFFIENPAIALAESHRVLSPNGRLAIATIKGPLPKPSLRTWWLLPPMGPALHAHTDQQMRELLTEAGFTAVEVGGESGPMAMQLAMGIRRG